MEDQPVAKITVSIWKKFTKFITYWKGSCKSSRPGLKLYEALLNHFRDLLKSMKLQFFSFLAGILKPYLTVFQTNSPIKTFTPNHLEKFLSNCYDLFFEEML